MIFAAGLGTRMGALTASTPKPMLSFNGRHLIDYCLDFLQNAGITKIVANTHYLPEELEAHLSNKGVITSREDVLLETGGGLKAALPLLGDGPVITINPDVLWHGPNPVTAILEAWRPDMTALLMVCEAGHEESDFRLYEGELQRNGPFRYTGLQVIRPEGLSDIEQQVFSLNRFWDRILSRGALHGSVYKGNWQDVGTEADFHAANARYSS
ncbi:MAG: nucleotidyltransferase family protein [Pseudomonadota bacterium]